MFKSLNGCHEGNIETSKTSDQIDKQKHHEFFIHFCICELNKKIYKLKEIFQVELKIRPLKCQGNSENMLSIFFQ